jgi:hypothetical protein
MKLLKIIPIIAIAFLAACKSTVPQSESLLEERVSPVIESGDSSAQEFTPESSSCSSSSITGLPKMWYEDPIDTSFDEIDLRDFENSFPLCCINLPEDDNSQKDSLKSFRQAECSLMHAIYYVLADDRSIDPWGCDWHSQVADCKVQFNDNKLLFNVLSEAEHIKTSVTIADGIATIQENLSETKIAEFCNFHKNDPKVAHVECFNRTIIYTMKEKFIIDNMNNLFDDFKYLCGLWLTKDKAHCEIPNGDN